MDKLPIQNILRQLLCGAVFFASIGLLLPNEDIKFFIDFHVKDMGTFWLGCAFVMSLAVGTLIYHIEKNFYSYFIQLLLGWKKEVEAKKLNVKISSDGSTCKQYSVHVAVVCPGEQVTLDAVTVENTNTAPSLFVPRFGVILAILSGVGIVVVLCHSLWRNFSWVSLPVVAMIVYIAIFVGLLVGAIIFLIRLRFINHLISKTRELWLAESGEQEDKTNSVIMRRVANWSDFIHCGQCCAFAWILGSFCVLCYCLRYTPGNVPYTRINIGLLCSLLLLSLELIADWHRYHHVLYVLNNKSDGKSQPNPTSNSHQ